MKEDGQASPGPTMMPFSDYMMQDKAIAEIKTGSNEEHRQSTAKITAPPQTSNDGGFFDGFAKSRGVAV